MPRLSQPEAMTPPHSPDSLTRPLSRTSPRSSMGDDLGEKQPIELMDREASSLNISSVGVRLRNDVPATQETLPPVAINGVQLETNIASTLRDPPPVEEMVPLMDEKQKALLKKALVRYPDMIVKRPKWSKTFIMCMFERIGRLLFVMSNTSPATLNDDIVKEMREILTDIESFGCDSTFISDMQNLITEAQLVRTSMQDMIMKTKALEEKVKELQLTLEQTQADLKQQYGILDRQISTVVNLLNAEWSFPFRVRLSPPVRQPRHRKLRQRELLELALSWMFYKPILQEARLDRTPKYGKAMVLTEHVTQQQGHEWSLLASGKFPCALVFSTCSLVHFFHHGMLACLRNTMHRLPFETSSKQFPSVHEVASCPLFNIRGFLVVEWEDAISDVFDVRLPPVPLDAYKVEKGIRQNEVLKVYFLHTWPLPEVLLVDYHPWARGFQMGTMPGDLLTLDF
ncbi:uncharacterized protein G2W53_017654 [Senna tora]|uniref:Uncharacterized protein n=1 Tax=Senna tora TaxID=362788 RepID=A0A834WKD7_9FABA|nr:uncharacterized protein G2W53_017654 [Senna tora]